MEFRGHDHIIEIAVFAPAVAYPAIRELAGLPVRVHLVMKSRDLLIIIQANDRSTKPALYIATASRDKTIKLWDCQTGQMLRNLVCLVHYLILLGLSAFLLTGRPRQLGPSSRLPSVRQIPPLRW